MGLSQRFALALSTLTMVITVSGCTSASRREWSATGTMTECHFWDTATLLADGKVLVAGGGSDLASTELYDPATGTWTAAGDMEEGRWQHSTTLLPDGKVLAMGGADSSGFPLSSTELYDPASGVWVPWVSLDIDRAGHTTVLLPEGSLSVMGGARIESDFLSPLASTVIFDPDSQIRTAGGTMHEARYFHTATVLADGKVLVAGGRSPGGDDPTRSSEIYDPTTDSWAATGTMLAARSGHTSTLLSDGKVLVVGGTTFNDQSGGPIASAELFDPKTGTWSAVDSMDVARAAHTATPLPDGTVLVAGGSPGSGDAVASVELFDPSTGHWSAAASLGNPRFSQTATLLPDGTVLVAGGSAGEGTYSCGLTSAELYAE